MHIKPLQIVLTFLAVLGIIQAQITPITECTAQAWVRAPDLAPDTLVRGDARVKISAECAAVEKVLLGLRLKERAFVKTLRSREDRESWKRSAHPQHIDLQQASPWDFPPARFSNRSGDAKFEEILADKDLWLVREEQRVVFEATQVIPVREGDHDIIQDFAVLVPPTNFPPALDYLHSGIMIDIWGTEIINVESIYEYFIRISFSNGTTEDVSAGFTGFQPFYDRKESHRTPTPETVVLKEMHAPWEYSTLTNYTARISGLVFTEGSDNQAITVVITRTGPARKFTAPLTIRGCVEPTFSSKWATKYDGMIPGSQPVHKPGHVLRSTLEDVQDAKPKPTPWGRLCFFGQGGTVSVTMPNSTDDEIQSHATVTTTSPLISMPLNIDRRHISNFETYYQTLGNSLQIILEIPCTADEVVRLDDRSAGVPNWDFPDDDEPWVPWEKANSGMPHPELWAIYSGTVPAVVHPIADDLSLGRYFGLGMNALGQVVLPGERGCEQHSLTHYLDEGARGPTFVDPIIVGELLAGDPTEREVRAPILEPKVSSPPEGEELVCRYYRISDLRQPPIYVGETWAKKVAKTEHAQKTSSIN